MASMGFLAYSVSGRTEVWPKRVSVGVQVRQRTVLKLAQRRGGAQ
jgi:hypothetical protein